MKNTQTRVRISQENTETLKKLAEESGLQQVDVATMLLHSALNVVRSHPGRTQFPIKFKIDELKEGTVRYEASHCEETPTRKVAK